MSRFKVTYVYQDEGTEEEFHYEATLMEAVHQGLMRPSVQRLTVEKL